MKTLSTALFSILLTGCSTLDIPVADTFNERLAIAYASVTAVRRTATTLLDAKKLSADDGDNVLKLTDHARAGLDIARTLSRSDMTGANAKLASIRTAVTAIQTYLASREKTSP